jgi:hypothetical protein
MTDCSKNCSPRSFTSWMEEGIEKGERNVIYKLLRRRCGELPHEVTTRLNALTLAQLDVLSDALLDFTHLNDLTAWLDANA